MLLNIDVVIFQAFIYFVLNPNDISAHGSSNGHPSDKSDVQNHNNYEYDPSYAYVLFKNR